MVVVVDERERGTPVPAFLAKVPGVEVRAARLPAGDYAVGVVGIERKTAADLGRSIVDGRFFRQLGALRRLYARPILILEGLRDGRGEAGVPWHALRGALVSVAAGFGIPILRAASPGETAWMIADAARQQRRAFTTGYARPGFRPSGWRRRALFLLQGLPGVGPGRAAALLDAFGSVRAVLAADERALSAVFGIGRATARRIFASCAEGPGNDAVSDRGTGKEDRPASSATGSAASRIS